MSNLTVKVTDNTGRELSFREQVAAAKDAWQRALEAIDEAWRLTPGVALKQRISLSRGLRNQGIAHDAARAMKSNLGDIERTMAIHDHAREKGVEWAVEDDEAAAESWARQNA